MFYLQVTFRENPGPNRTESAGMFTIRRAGTHMLSRWVATGEAVADRRRSASGALGAVVDDRHRMAVMA